MKAIIAFRKPSKNGAGGGSLKVATPGVTKNAEGGVTNYAGLHQNQKIQLLQVPYKALERTSLVRLGKFKYEFGDRKKSY